MQLEISEEEFYHLLHSAVQYAMGRKSYIVESTCNTVKQYFHLLTKSHKATLLKNITNEFNWYTDRSVLCGMQMDHDRWVDLLKFLKEVE